MPFTDNIKITTSTRIPENMELSFIYRHGQIYDMNEIKYIGKNNKIKSGYYYIYCKKTISKNKFKQLFNESDYGYENDKIQDILVYINNKSIFKQCINK